MTTEKKSDKNRAQRRADKNAARKAPRRAAVAEARPTTPPVAVEPENPTEPDTEDGEPETQNVSGFEGSYQRFEAEARALDAREVPVFTGNGMVVFQNARRGVQAVMAERATIEADPASPTVDWDAVALAVTAGEALVYAGRLATNATASKGELSKKIRDAFESRDVLLSSAIAAVKAKAVKGEEGDKLTKIQKGSGPIDGAQDCIELAAWFRANASALAGKTAVTREQVELAATRGSELLHLLAPGGVEAAQVTVDPMAAAAEMRDRMAVVVARRYAYVARVGGWCWGLDVGRHVPLLRSRVVSAAKVSAEPPVEPVTP